MPYSWSNADNNGISIQLMRFCTLQNDHRPDDYGNESGHWLKRIIKAGNNVSKVLLLKTLILTL